MRVRVDEVMIFDHGHSESLMDFWTVEDVAFCTDGTVPGALAGLDGFSQGWLHPDLRQILLFLPLSGSRFD